jgi:chromosome partitioning protein
MSGKNFVPVIAVLNMKGGVGKTTISAHVLRVLYERRRLGTLLIDLDPQFNLTQALLTKENYDEVKSKNKTIMSVMEAPPDVGLFDVKTSSLHPPEAADVIRGFYTFNSMVPPQDLDLVPGDFRLVKYSLMDDSKKLSFVKDRFVEFINETKKHYKIICIDCNPSSSFLTLCALRVCTHLLVPVRPDKYSVLGLDMLHQFVNHLPGLFPKPQYIVLLNGMPATHDATSRNIEAELRGHAIFGSWTLASSIHETTLLRARPDYTGFATDRRVSWSSKLRTTINGVSDELAGRLGL